MQRTTRGFLWAALAALPAAALLHLLSLLWPLQLWPAMVHLTLFGWISLMICGINYHTMPVFSGREFPAQRPIWLHLGASVAGVASAAAGLAAGWRPAVIAGLALQIGGAALFMANTILLFTRGRQHGRRPPPALWPGQQLVDRQATRATKLAGVSLPLALLLLLGQALGWLDPRWTLAAEHLAALGWIMLMIVGVAYHVLPRWTARSLRGPGWARAQVLAHIAALALMVPALGMGWGTAFAAGGLLMTLSVMAFIWTVWPVLRPRAPQPHATIELQEIVRR